MLGKLPYYLEANTFITGTCAAKYYANATPYPLKCLTDQAPLQHIKTCSKGHVTAWHIEHLWDVDYVVEYRKDSWNTVANTLLRYPMLGPERLAWLGLEKRTEGAIIGTAE